MKDDGDEDEDMKETTNYQERKNTRRHNRGGKNQRLDCIKLITNNS